MTTDKVKWFGYKKGFGFITPEGGRANIFVHFSDMKKGHDFTTIKKGMSVQFDVVEGKKGLKAANVTVVS